MNFIKKFVQSIKNEMAGIEVKGSIEVKSSESNKQTEELEYDLITDFNELKQQLNTVYFKELREEFLEKVNQNLNEDTVIRFYSGFDNTMTQYFDTESLSKIEVDFIIYVLKKYLENYYQKISFDKFNTFFRVECQRKNKKTPSIKKEKILDLVGLELSKQQAPLIFNREVQQEDYKLYFLAAGFLNSVEKLKQDFPFQYQKFGYQFSDTVQNITRIIKNEYDELDELSTENEKIILNILQPIWEEMDSKHKELTIKQKEYEKEMRETSIQSRAELLKMELEIVNKIREKQSTTESNDIANIILNDINKEKGDE